MPSRPSAIKRGLYELTFFANGVAARGLPEADVAIGITPSLSGALLAARAGLLANRCCTTHHDLLKTLRALAPQAQVIDNRVFVVDGPLASSAGITAGIDLSLHLIAGECGEALAAGVAEDPRTHVTAGIEATAPHAVGAP